MQSYSDLCAPQLFFDRKQWMVPLGIIHVKDGESQGQLTKVVPKKKKHGATSYTERLEQTGGQCARPGGTWGAWSSVLAI